MIDCSKTKNYFAEKQRMTKRHKLNSGVCVCKLNCVDCPLSSFNNGTNVPCADFERFYPNKAIAIIQKWSDEHPQKTCLSTLLEHFPNVPLNDDGIPKLFCPYRLGLTSTNDCRADHDCVKCWNQPIENDEEGEKND